MPGHRTEGRRPSRQAGFLLAPSQGQAAAAILRSGHMANHEQGAFDIALDSRRTRRASDILQGLTRDQPLAALYGYRIERGLRDALLGKFIWPLRLAYPWRPIGGGLPGDATEAIGAGDVVDGVAVLADWESGPGTVFAKLAGTLAGLDPPAPAASPGEQQTIAAIIADAEDLADSVSDLLLAEGAHQIVQGNPRGGGDGGGRHRRCRSNQVGRTLRGGASYTQRIVVVSDPVDGWPDDRRSRRAALTPGSRRCWATPAATVRRAGIAGMPRRP
jgi:hypothetical protein